MSSADGIVQAARLAKRINGSAHRLKEGRHLLRLDQGDEQPQPPWTDRTAIPPAQNIQDILAAGPTRRGRERE